MKKRFEMMENNRVVRERYKLNLNIPRTNQVTFGTNSRMVLKFGMIYLLISRQLKILVLLKLKLKTWNGASCSCIICSQ